MFVRLWLWRVGSATVHVSYINIICLLCHFFHVVWKLVLIWFWFCWFTYKFDMVFEWVFGWYKIWEVRFFTSRVLWNLSVTPEEEWGLAIFLSQYPRGMERPKGTNDYVKLKKLKTLYAISCNQRECDIQTINQLLLSILPIATWV